VDAVIPRMITLSDCQEQHTFDIKSFKLKQGKNPYVLADSFFQKCVFEN